MVKTQSRLQHSNVAIVIQSSKKIPRWKHHTGSIPVTSTIYHNKGVIIISRSYKKTPYCGDKKSKDLKRYANRVIRQRLKNSDDKLNYKSYRKAYESWNICDFYTIAPDFETYYKFMVDQWHSRQANGWHEPYPTREQTRKEYRKYYKNK